MMKRFLVTVGCALAISMVACNPTTNTPDGGTPDAATQDTAAADTVATKDTGGDTSMSFFITSEGSGDGGNIGGLAGADAHCKKLAEAAGVTGKTWAAYLSSSTENARDRIGAGPWYNAKGTMIAKDVDDLHSDNNAINKDNGLDEKGEQVNGRGDTPNEHDILTGSTSDGKVSEGKTCEDWTSNSTGSAMVGHHDKMGLDETPPSKSWNSSHASKSCSPADLKATGGNGFFYCFAK